MEKKFYLVTNRSASRVYYSVPELGIKLREYQPGETKRVTREELEGLHYIPGGANLIRGYLLIRDEELRNDIVGPVEPEYNMTADQVKELILHGSQDEWLDCLDFAPAGVIDLVKELSVALPLTDTVKMESFKEKKGIDLDKLIKIKREEKQEEEAKKVSPETTVRRTQKSAEPAPAAAESSRRTTGEKYKVVTKE